MQDLNRISNLGTSYTSTQVLALLLGSVVREYFQFIRIDKDGNFTDISQFVQPDGSAIITHDSTSIVPRKIQCQIRGDAGLDWYNDQIRVVYRLGTNTPGEYLDFVQGTFVATTPGKKHRGGEGIWYRYVGADYCQLLNDKTLSDNLTIAAGAYFFDQAIALAKVVIPSLQYIGITNFKTLPTALTWRTGNSYLSVINDLLSNGGYQAVWADELGRLRIDALVRDYSALLPSYTFDGTQPNNNIVAYEFLRTPDLTQAFNQFLVQYQNPQSSAPINAAYTNVNPFSKISIYNYRQKLQVIQSSAIADLATAQAMAQIAAQTASQKYDQMMLPTAPWPVSQHKDIYVAGFQTTDEGLLYGTFLEASWRMVCATGGQMLHGLEQVFAV